jgi:hypothetical protein
VLTALINALGDRSVADAAVTAIGCFRAPTYFSGSVNDRKMCDMTSYWVPHGPKVTAELYALCYWLT